MTIDPPLLVMCGHTARVTLSVNACKMNVNACNMNVNACKMNWPANAKSSGKNELLPRITKLRDKETERFAAKQREVANALDSGEVEMAEAQLQIEHYWAGALRRAVIDGDIESGSVMAGQSVGMVNREEPVAAIIQELVDEASAALESRG